MLNHQNKLAQVKVGSSDRAVSHIFGLWTSALDCRQNRTSHSSRKYHPLPTIPCSLGLRPVRYVAWTGHVTAGSTVLIEAPWPRSAKALRYGVEGPSRPGVSPTTL